jgi:integrase
MKLTAKGKCGNYHYRFMVKGKLYPGSTRTNNKELAMKIAKLTRRKVVEKAFDEVDKLRSHRSYATIGEVIEVFEKSSTVNIGDRAKRNYVNCLLGILKNFHSDPRAQSAAILTRGLVNQWQSLPLNKKTLNSMLTQARSVFSNRVIFLYKELKLPDLADFLKAPKLRVETTPWIPPTPEMIDKIELEYQKLEPRLKRVHLLFSRCGLRNCEIIPSKRKWIEARVENGVVRRYIGIVERLNEGFKPKGMPRWVPLDDEVWNELGEGDPDDFLIPAKNKTERFNLVMKVYAKWMRQFTPNRTKSAYELRKLAGSVVATKHGLYAAQSFLGHKDPKTTSDYYVTMLRSIPPLCGNDLRLSRN